MRLRAVPSILVGLALLAACASPPAASPTDSASAVGSASPTLPPTAPPTPTTSPSLSAPPSASLRPSPSLTLPSSPSASPSATQSATDLLISYASPDLQATCQLAEPLYDDEVVSVTCGEEDLRFDYSLFASHAAMAAAYNRDLRGAETPPQPDGTCSEGNYESTYTISEQVAGRINCRLHEGSSGAMYNVIEWTNDALLVIGYISNRVDLHTWDELIEFWETQAGPFAP